MSETKVENVEVPFRALVLDDDESIRNLLTRTLVSSGFEVEAVENGRQGLFALLRQDFDVLLVDIAMAEMNGTAFLQEAINFWPWVSVLIITGYPHSSLTDQAEKLGVRRIHEKPLALQTLLESAREAATAKRNRLQQTSSRQDARDHRQLGILENLTKSVTNSDSLVQGLQQLADSVAETLPCDVVCILDMRQETPRIVARLHKTVSQDLINDLSDQLISHYKALSGEYLDSTEVKTQVEGGAISPDGPNKVEKTFMMPLVSDSSIGAVLAHEA